jgi:hypothetical protein
MPDINVIVKRFVFAIVIGLLVFLFVIGRQTSTCLVVSEYSPRRSDKALMIPVEENDSFAIEYMHSVLKTQVKDLFRITRQKQIILEETVYESMGIGLPTNTPYEFSLADGKFHIRGINQVIPEIPLRVGRIANHKILIREQEFNLKDYFPPETLLIIKTEEKRVYEYWLREN